MLASVVANFSHRAPKEPVTPDDFMPSRKPAREKTDEEIAEEFAAKFQFIAIPPGVEVPPVKRDN